MDKNIFETPQTWYFTFGSNHTDSKGRSLGNSYVAIDGTYSEARNKIFAARDARWSFQYESAERAGVIEFNLVKKELEDVTIDH